MTMPLALALVGVCGLLAVTVATLLAVRCVGRLDARWRPIVVAYLTAQAAAAGRTLDIVDPAAPPGQVFPPLFEEPSDDATPDAADDDW